MCADAASLWQLAGEAVALYLRGAPGREVRLDPGGWLALSGAPCHDLNMALVDRGPHAEARLRGYAAAAAARGLPHLVFLTTAAAGALAPVARDLGLQPAGRAPLMTLEPAGDDAPAPCAVAVDVVADAAGLAVANAVAAAAFDIAPGVFGAAVGPALLAGPGCALFLGREHGAPVGTVATVRAGETVGIWTMGTAPAHQRRGIGRAVLAAAIAHHRARGARRFYLLATEAGKPLYDRLGFRTVDAVTIWAGGPGGQAAH